MGERALAFCSLSEGGQELFYSQWAGCESVVGRVLVAESFERQCETLMGRDWQYRRHLSPGATGYDIDYLSIAVVYQLTSVAVIPYAVFWCGFAETGVSANPDLGMLIPLEERDSLQRYRTQFQQLKTPLEEAIARGYMSIESAVRVLIASVDCSNSYLSPACQQLTEDL